MYNTITSNLIGGAAYQAMLKASRIVWKSWINCYGKYVPHIFDLYHLS